MVALLLAACNGGSLPPSTGDLAMPDLAQPDLLPIGWDGVTCGNSTCPGGMVCCGTGPGNPQMCAASCAVPDGGNSFELDCDGPEDCPTQKGLCCAHFMVFAGTFPNCPYSALASCDSVCNYHLPNSCPGMGQARLCHKSADCADDPNATNCCHLVAGTIAADVCVNNAVMQFIVGTGGRCM